jgi:putative transposase
MYDYRVMTPEERARVNDYRRRRNLPKHSPPHWAMGFSSQYLITASCFEHAQIIGKSLERLTECEEKLLDACKQHATTMPGAFCLIIIMSC